MEVAMKNFDSIVTGAIEIAQTEALNRKHPEIYPEHLVLGLIRNPQSYCSRALKKEAKNLEKLLGELPTVKGDINLENIRPSTKLSTWLTYASSHATQNGKEEVCEKDLLRFLPKILPDFQIDFEKFNNPDEEQEVPTFLVNLNELAEQNKLDPVIGRSKEIRAVMEILGRRGKNNPVLVGPAGVGKTAIVEGLADAIVKNKVPDILKDKTVYSLDMGALMAGTKFRGEFEERLQGLIKFLKEKSGEAILFIDEMHQLVGAGKTDGAMDAANLLKPALARGELNCIGATTFDEYQKYILGDSALDRRFRSVPVHEPSKEDAVEIMMGLKDKLEAHHGIKILDEAIFSSVFLSTQYITDKNLPDKSIDLLDEAASALKLSAEAMPASLVELEGEIRSKKIYAQMEDKNESLKDEIKELEADFKMKKEKWEEEILSVKKVSELKHELDRYKFDLEQAERNADFESASKLKYSLIPEIEGKLSEVSHDWTLKTKHIAQVISRQTGIPVEKILKDKQDNILKLEDFLKEKVLGQDEVLKEIAETILTSHAGLKDESKPLASFMLKGPSGVGKTETAKTLSEFLFDSTDNLIRFDMSEFSEKHSVSKLIGAPAGYIGYDEGGVLTEAIRRKPYSVILFDEIEKAHHDFSDILLQILDDGRLTDNKGRTVNFKNTIILLTTNSISPESDFKPEVLGRLDGVLEYHSLGKEVIYSLIDKQLELLNGRLKDKNFDVVLGKEMVETLAERGHDERYGARPLAGVFNKLVIRPLSRKLLETGGGHEHTHLTVNWDEKANNTQIIQ
tara:strand:+ start:92971 stop:95355 length:2385 start_codon:yes stop_codon:yes gene_type:complete